MKKVLRWMTFAAALLGVQVALGQQSGAPAGSTGQCKDGTYSQSASKSGACRGHQGVKEWYAASTTTPMKSTAPATTSAPAPAPMAAPAPAAKTTSSTSAKSSPQSKAAAMPQAAGGGPGLVWVNSSSNVYHCYGSDYYGKTKQGSYMSEADAKAKGAHHDHGKACSK